MSQVVLPGEKHGSRSARALAAVLREEFGVPFIIRDGRTGACLWADDRHPAAGAAACGGDGADTDGARTPPGAMVISAGGGAYRVQFAVRDPGGPPLIASGRLPALARTAAGEELERSRLEKWVRSVAARLEERDDRGRPRPPEPAAPGSGRAAWETLLNLDYLLRNLRIHKAPAGNVERILQAAFAAVPMQALVWVPRHADLSVQVRGELDLSPWDCRQLASQLAQEPDLQATGCLLCDRVQDTAWGPRYPDIATLLAFSAPDRETGWLLALNRRAGDRGPAPAAFQRSDAALLTPYVGLLDGYVRGAARYRGLKELLVGLTRSLTAAIDAKDSYTYGHSERVARIAVELGRELGLQEDELSDIYLAGLLHDIGKIGVRDAILGKKEPLTPEEFEHVKQHVTIGFNILAGLRPIRNLLPGVLYHHERYDGKGYPEGLKGESIPLLARILAVADAYDAMSTSRPYRSEMPRTRVEEVLAQGAGSQWDARVIEAFQRCKEKVHAVRQRGVGESLRQALDGALRRDDSSIVWNSHTSTSSR